MPLGFLQPKINLLPYFFGVFMTTFFYLTVTTVDLILLVIQICMFGRVIFGLFPFEENPLNALFIFFTEPVIYPVRRICEKFGIAEGLPIDIPFFITFILLSTVSMLI